MPTGVARWVFSERSRVGEITCSSGSVGGREREGGLGTEVRSREENGLLWIARTLKTLI